MFSPDDRQDKPEAPSPANEEDEGVGVLEGEEGEEDQQVIVQCQNPGCQNKEGTSIASLVCHNLDCQVLNNNRPVHLCGFCDEEVHQGDKTAHVRFTFEAPKRPEKRLSGEFSDLDSDLSTPDQTASRNTSLHPHKLAQLIKAADHLQRKKQSRRHNTDDPGKEWFALTIRENDPPEVIPALKGKTLREALQPAFERHQIAIGGVQVCVRGSKSPLSYQCDTFCLGGQHLRVELVGVAASGTAAKQSQRRSVGSLFSRMRPLSAKIRGSDHHHKVNERLFKNVHRWELRRPTMENDIKRSNSMPHNNGKRKNIRNLLGSDVPLEESQESTGDLTPEKAVNGDIFHETELETKGTSSRKKGNKVNALLGTSFANPAERTFEEELEFLSVYGLPSLNNRGKEEEKMRLISWKELVPGSEKISKRERDQQEAIWELINTELSYCQKVKALWEVFYVALAELQKKQFLKHVDVDRLFGNIREVYDTCVSFWEECLYPLYKQCQQNKFRLHPFQIVDAFDRFEDQFFPYEEFCMKERDYVAYLSSLKNESAEFRLYLHWCERHPECNRMQLADLFGKPRNRITQYPLLLKRIQQHTDDEEAKERLHRLRDRVDCFLNQVNSALARREQVEMLQDLMGKIEGYVGVEILPEYEKYVSDVLTLNLLAPMPDVPITVSRIRHLIHDGDLKLKDSATKEIHCYIFTDMLLLTTRPKKGGKVKIVYQPLRVDRIRCERLKDPGSLLLIHLSEYSLPVAFLHLQTSSSEQAKAWIEAVDTAKTSYFHSRQGHELLLSNSNYRSTFSGSSFSSSLSLPRDFSRTPSPFSSPGSSPPPRRSATLTSPVCHSASGIAQHTAPRSTRSKTLSQEYSPSLPSLLVSLPAKFTDGDYPKERHSFPESEHKALCPERRTQSVSDTNLDQLIESLPDTPCDEKRSAFWGPSIAGSYSADDLDKFEAKSAPLSRCRSQSVASYTPSPPLSRRQTDCNLSCMRSSSRSMDNLESSSTLETLQEERRRDRCLLSPTSKKTFLWHNQKITLNTSQV